MTNKVQSYFLPSCLNLFFFLGEMYFECCNRNRSSKGHLFKHFIVNIGVLYNVVSSITYKNLKSSFILLTKIAGWQKFRFKFRVKKYTLTNRSGKAFRFIKSIQNNGVYKEKWNYFHQQYVHTPSLTVSNRQLEYSIYLVLHCNSHFI